VFYFLFLNSISASSVVATYSNPFSISCSASLMLVAVSCTLSLQDRE
jgi:hypothetical protein